MTIMRATNDTKKNIQKGVSHRQDCVRSRIVMITKVTPSVYFSSMPSFGITSLATTTAPRNAHRNFQNLPGYRSPSKAVSSIATTPTGTRSRNGIAKNIYLSSGRCRSSPPSDNRRTDFNQRYLYVNSVYGNAVDVYTSILPDSWECKTFW